VPNTDGNVLLTDKIVPVCDFRVCICDGFVRLCDFCVCPGDFHLLLAHPSVLYFDSPMLYIKENKNSMMKNMNGNNQIY
jgi:hypothetical protein